MMRVDSVNIGNKKFPYRKPKDFVVFEKGATVRVIRPHLYSGIVGVVVGVQDGLHRIQIPLKEPIGTMTHMFCEAYSDTLESWL